MNTARPITTFEHDRRVLGAGLPILLAAVIGLLARDWIPAAGILTLWGIWALLYERGEGAVLPVALSFQWLQVSIGMYYFALTGRRPHWDYEVETDGMVIVGLCSVLTLAVGIRLGKSLLPNPRESGPVDTSGGIRLSRLLIVYAVLLLSSDFLSRFAWNRGGLAQLFLSLILIRFVFLYMLVGRLIQRNGAAIWLGLLFVCELAIGLTGYFARFRESFVIAFLAILGTIHRVRTRHVVVFSILTVMAVGVAWLWTGVKKDYRMEYASTGGRQERIMRIQALTQSWLGRRDDIMRSGDSLVDRIWSVEYQAHALERVPSIVPHTNGKLMMGAIQHALLPRVFFPDKPPPVHPSNLVRKYAGVWVSGEERGVSFAFGYAAESYVDFGIPMMFLPMLAFGILAGMTFGWLRRRLHNPLLRAGTLATLFWVSLYLYERSWYRLIGLSITWAVGLGGMAYLIDRFLLGRDSRQAS